MRRGDKARVIVAGRDDQPHRAVRTLVLVDLEQAFAQRVDGYADDSIGVGVEVGAPAEGLGGDGVLLNQVGPAGEAFFADVFKDAREVAGPAEDTGGEEPIEFPPFGFDLSFFGRSVLG